MGSIGLLIIVGIVVMLMLLISIRNSIRKLHLELNALTQRLDFMRMELNKLAAKPEPPIERKPGLSFEELAEIEHSAEPPLVTMRAPLPHTPKMEAWKPLEITPPPPLPNEEAWTLEPDEEEERRPSKLVESAREILSKMWNWILFGAEKKPDDVTLEYAIASTWLPRLGVIILVTGIVFLLTLSNLGAQERVAVSVIAGAVMLISGKRMLPGQYKLLGQGLLGGGLLVMYYSAFAAGPRYDLIEIPSSFALMMLVTVAAGVLAVRANSMLIAVIGIAGGYFTPVMLKTSGLPGLYSYILLLSLGILCITHYKQWRLLNYLGFVLTYWIFHDSLQHAYHKDDFPLAMPFLSAYFVIHSFIVYYHNVAKARQSTVLEITHLVANAVVFSWFGYGLIHEAYGRPYPSIMSVGLAVFYIAQVFIFLKKRLLDRQLLIALIAMAAMFTTWTLPLVFEKETLSIWLALLALTFLGLGMKVRSNFLQHFAYAVYVILFYRFLFLDLGREFDLKPSASQPMLLYWHDMLGRLWTFGVSIASIAAAFFLQSRQPAPAEALAVEEENDIPWMPKKEILNPVFYWFALVFAFLFAHLEINTMFVYYEPLRLPVLTFLWCGMGAYFLWKLARNDGPATIIFMAMCVFIIGAIVKLLAVDMYSWRMCDRFIYDMEYNFLYAGMRLLDFGLIVAVLLTVWRVVESRKKLPASVFGYGALMVFFLYASLELNSLLFWKLREFQAGGISVLWAVFAMAFIAGGIWKSVAPLRYAGLTLFLIVIAKVFVVDLRHMAVISKVFASIAVGGILLLGAFAYLRASRAFLKTGDERDNNED